MSHTYNEVLDFATEIFGSEIEAKEWMEKKSNTLGDSPINLIETDEGAVNVIEHLKRISRHRQA